VTVDFAVTDQVRVSTFTLTGPGGQAVAAYLLNPGAATENAASLLPKTPLVGSTTYTAHINALINGVQYDHVWSFTTAP